MNSAYENALRKFAVADLRYRRRLLPAEGQEFKLAVDARHEAEEELLFAECDLIYTLCVAHGVSFGDAISVMLRRRQAVYAEEARKFSFVPRMEEGKLRRELASGTEFSGGEPPEPQRTTYIVRGESEEGQFEYLLTDIIGPLRFTTDETRAARWANKEDADANTALVSRRTKRRWETVKTTTPLSEFGWDNGELEQLEAAKAAIRGEYDE